MLGLTDGQWGALGVGVGVASSLVTFIYSRITGAANRAHDLEVESLRSGAKADVNSLLERLDRTERGVDANWRKIDELREKYWSRDEQSRFREEIKSDMKALEDRVITAIRDTTNQIRADLRERRGGDSNE